MKIYHYLLFTILMGVFYIFFTSNKMAISDDWEIPSKFMKMKNPYADVKDNDQIGRRLYAIHCKSCHGTKGKGDGSKAKQLDTPVPDITTDEFKAQADGAIYYKTFIGREDMPGFLEKINLEEDQWLLVNYIKSL